MSIKIAFVGTGYINKIHAQAARACGADLTAVVNHKAESLTEFAKQFDILRQYATAQEVIAWSARELGESASAVIRQLDLQQDEVEVIQIGGLFEGGALYIEPLMHTVRETAPYARFIRLNVPPVIGSIILAMQKINVDPQSMRAHMIESTKALIHRLGVQI